MKKLVLLSFCVLFSAVIANAGVVRFAGKPAIKAAKFSAKKTLHAAKKSVKVAAKVVY